MLSRVEWKSFEQVSTYEVFKSGAVCCFAYGWRRILPRICSTSTLEVLLAREARMYANGQSQPSLSALTVMIYRISQFGLSKSIFPRSSTFEVLTAICSFGMPISTKSSLILSKVSLSSLIFGCAWNSTIGRIYFPPESCSALACFSRLPRSWIASWITACLLFLLNTTTGSLTIFSFFSSLAST